MMNRKFGIRKTLFATAFFVGLLSVPVLNVVIDPFEVFGTKVLPFTVANANMRQLKVERMQGMQYDLLVAGSSVTQMIDPRWIAGPDKDGFNMAAFSVDAAVLDQSVKYAARHLREGGKLLIGVDPAMFIGGGPRDGAYRMPYAVTGENPISWYIEYAFAASAKEIMYKLANVLTGDNIHLDLDYGHYRVVRWDQEMERDPEGYAARKFSQKEIEKTGKYRASSESFTHLESLARWLESRRIETTWVFMPVHPAMRKHIGENELSALYDRTRAAIAGSMPSASVLDFIDHEIARDNQYWYEHKHFSPTGGKRLASELRKSLYDERTTISKKEESEKG